MRKKSYENVCHFITSKIAIDMQPLGQRIDGTHEPENRQLHVARCNGAVLDTALKHFTQLLIELAPPQRDFFFGPTQTSQRHHEESPGPPFHPSTMKCNFS